MKKLTIDQAQFLADMFRANNGLSVAEPINLKSLLRKLNILTMYKPLSNTFYGLTLKSPSGAQFILINSNNTIGRQHFTIAHELYHLNYDGQTLSHTCNEEKEKPSVEERNADLFASALLMPKQGIFEMLTVEDVVVKKNITLAKVIKLEQYFSVSRQALLYRLKQLNLITESQLKVFLTYHAIETAKQYGANLSLYNEGNKDLVIGDFGEKARQLYDSDKISEGHYRELLNLITNYES